MKKHGERLQAFAMKNAGSALLQVWHRPWLAAMFATSIDWGIRSEAMWRRVAFPFARHRPRPLVNWHEGGSGQPLLLLNGFTANGLTWPTRWLRRLGAHYRVIRIDNRGTGWSRDAPGPFTIADLADDARDVLHACGVKRATVFGLSMGGIIGQELAIRHPGMVEKLVLAATIPPVPAWIATQRGAALAAAILPDGRDVASPSREHLAAAGRVLMQFAADGFTPADDVVEEMVAQTLIRATSRRGAVMQARAIQAWRQPHRLASISAPTVVVHGAAERIIPVENARRLSRLIPDAKLVELPGVGHLIPWEAEDALVDILCGQ